MCDCSVCRSSGDRERLRASGLDITRSPLLSILAASFTEVDNARRGHGRGRTIELQPVRHELFNLSILAPLSRVRLNRPTWGTVVCFDASLVADRIVYAKVDVAESNSIIATATEFAASQRLNFLSIVAVSLPSALLSCTASRLRSIGMQPRRCLIARATRLSASAAITWEMKLKRSSQRMRFKPSKVFASFIGLAGITVQFIRSRLLRADFSRGSRRASTFGGLGSTSCNTNSGTSTSLCTGMITSAGTPFTEATGLLSGKYPSLPRLWECSVVQM